MGTSNINVACEIVDAKQVYYPATLTPASPIMNIDGTNRNVSFPSGSLLDLSGATTTVKFAAGTIAGANIASNTISAAKLQGGIVNSDTLAAATTDGLGAARIGKWSYVFGTTGNAISLNYNLSGGTLPANAVVYHGIIAVTSPFVAVGCGLSIGLVANADLLANTNVNVVAAFNANGQSNTIPNIVNIGTAIKTSAALIPHVDFAGANCNTGKFNLYLHYLVTD